MIDLNEIKPPQRGRINFGRINAAALGVLPSLLRRWLPDARVEGHEYMARNPTRPDQHSGSFCINRRNGRWADFATGDRGGDLISLAAYLAGISQSEAALRLAHMLGVEALDG